MPTLEWIGKSKVINHHLDVPYRVLGCQYTYTENGNATDESENKIIRGDNLEALKALLPQYEGKIKCIYIDPPYNTGNDNSDGKGWVYNDKVDDPKIRRWLDKIVGIDDLTRHDKWLCMMYPRLKLLQRLLSNDGLIFVSIDDLEQAPLKLICDEIFGANNFAAQIIWEKVYSPRMDVSGFSNSHDYILCYVKGTQDDVKKEVFQQNTSQFNAYDENVGKYYRRRSVRKEGSHSTRAERPNLFYALQSPDGDDVYPIKPDGTEGCWRWSISTYQKNNESGIVEWVKNSTGWQVYAKQYLEETAIRPPSTLWKHTEVGHNHSAVEDIKMLLGGRVFNNPKPKELIEKIISISMEKDDIILDSFAGSGTTAHAVLNMNKQDGGNRKFILVEMMDYAETITAERVRRVIDGYADVEGTGGSFSFYDLGHPLLLDNHLLNEDVPINKIREYVFYMETKRPMPQTTDADNPYYLGKNNETAYYFYYEKERVTTLGPEFLTTVKTQAEEYIVYADQCMFTLEDLKKYNIVFKKIPRDIAKL